MEYEGNRLDESTRASQSDAKFSFSNAAPLFQQEIGANEIPPGTTPSEARTSSWKLKGSPVSDLSTEHDNLGFSPYVDAVAAFLKDEDTRPPLTISIEGEWGTGKSSFMRQLKAELDKPPASIDGAPNSSVNSKTLTFWFNAWRHDKQDAMWAAFALNITKKIRNEQNVIRRLRSDLKLTVSRIENIGGWIHTVSVLLLWLVVAMGAAGVLVYAFNLSSAERGQISQRLWETLGSAGKNGSGAAALFVAKMSAAHYWFVALFFVGCYWLWINRHVGRRLELNLEKYLDKPDYKGRISFIENFHYDFRKVVDAYAGERRVFVFIDDLDRCDVPRAADLMQAINLMIGEDEHLVFILGMDREKIAAGITLKYKDLTPFLKSSSGEESVSARHPSAFGYSFLEKFIQITFRVPRPSEDGIENFLRSLGQDEKSIQTDERRREAERTIRRERRKAIEVRSRADSIEVREQVKLVAPVLEWNPRRIKQFINDFRLQAYIASDLGLLDLVSEEDGPEAAKITLEQLGKFVALTMTWPDLVMDLIEFPDLLSLICRNATSQDSSGTTAATLNDQLKKLTYTSPAKNSGSSDNQPFMGRKYWLVQRWSEEAKLIALLNAKCSDEESGRYSLEETDLRVLLNIAPRVRRTESIQSTPEYTDKSRSQPNSNIPSVPIGSGPFESEQSFAGAAEPTASAETYEAPQADFRAAPNPNATKVGSEIRPRSSGYNRKSSAPTRKK